MQKVWDILLDDDFMMGYEHGFVVTCHDNIARRFYPRIFTYSADYPEKYVVFTAREVDIFYNIFSGCLLQPFVGMVAVLALGAL